MASLFAAALFLYIAGYAMAQTPTPSPSPSPAVAPPAIHVYSCQTVSGLFLPSKNEAGLAVRFTNSSQQPYRDIVWRARYGEGYIDFIDNGLFSPGVSIDNFLVFKASNERFSVGNLLLGLTLAMSGNNNGPNPWIANTDFVDYAGTEDPENCTIVSAIDGDGVKWTNPDAPLPHVRIPLDAAYGLPSVKATPPPQFGGGIEVTSCAYWLHGRGTMDVVFHNAGTQAVRRVVFRGLYRNSGIDFADDGVFSPNVKVEHSLKAPVPPQFRDALYLSFDEPALCPVVSVQYADGTSWQNPQIPATPGPYAAPVPDALVLMKEDANVWKRARVHGMPTPVPAPSSQPTAAARP